MPFVLVNVPPFYTTMIRRMQVEWTHIYQLFMNNAAATVMTDKYFPPLVTPYLPHLSIPSKFCGGECLPNVIPNSEYVLKEIAAVLQSLQMRLILQAQQFAILLR